MVRIIVQITLVLVSLVVSAQQTASETRDVAAFSSISVASAIEVYYTQQDKEPLTVEADSKERLALLVTEVKEGVLKIYIKKQKETKRDDFGVIKVYVSNPSVTKFSVSSAASVTLQNTVTVPELKISLSSAASFNGVVMAKTKATVELDSAASFEGALFSDNLKIEMSSAASLTAKVEAKFVKVDLNSSARARLSGVTQSLDLSASSMANFYGVDFAADKAKLEATSLGVIEVLVTESLNAEANSLGKITYIGTPKTIEKREGDVVNK